MKKFKNTESAQLCKHVQTKAWPGYVPNSVGHLFINACPARLINGRIVTESFTFLRLAQKKWTAQLLRLLKVLIFQ